jgi:hypothetical protein
MRGSWLKKTVGVSALCFAGPLMAAGPLDGIYQIEDFESWLSVHQSGSHVIVGEFFKISGTFSQALRNGQTYSTDVGSRWNLLSGDLVSGSNSLTIVGETQLGACFTNYRIDFGAPQLWMELVSMTTTPAGAAKGIDCPGEYAARTTKGTWYKIYKIF